MILEEKLQQAIDEAYKVFSRYKRPRSITNSCQEELLNFPHEAPLRELRGEQISPYAGHALTTASDHPDYYKYFLPRFLELAVQMAPYTGLGPEIIAKKLVYADWRTWPEDERTAIGAVYREAWNQAVTHDPDDVNAQSWLCGMAISGEPITGLLAAWPKLTGKNAMFQLADFIYTAHKKHNERWLSSHWQDVDDDMLDTLNAFRTSDQVKSALNNMVESLDESGDSYEKDYWRLVMALQQVE